MTNEDSISVTKSASEAVDQLADELVKEFDSAEWRTWYCKIIWALGVDEVKHIKIKASSGRVPGKLFGYLIKKELQNVHCNEFSDTEEELLSTSQLDNILKNLSQ